MVCVPKGMENDSSGLRPTVITLGGHWLVSLTTLASLLSTSTETAERLLAEEGARVLDVVGAEWSPLEPALSLIENRHDPASRRSRAVFGETGVEYVP